MNAGSLRNLGACAGAVAWLAEQPDADTAWSTCPRGDWMLWLLGRLAGLPWSRARRRLVLACCECARLALVHAPAGEDRPRIAIETAERWGRGERVTRADVRAAAHSAHSADAAATAAYSAFSAATADDDAAAWGSVMRQCADIVRRHYPSPPVIP
jgi:hypothetical protein